jgi:hypothetical protein
MKKTFQKDCPELRVYKERSDLRGLIMTAGTLDHSREFRGVGVTLVHWEVRSRARGRLLILSIAIAIHTNEYTAVVCVL